MDTKKLRQKILDLAIHGKLVPQDPNDEPASVLLERIHAEKEALIKEGKIKRTKKTTASDTSHYENVPFEVPDGWCWTTLGKIGTWQAGGTPSRMHKEYYGGNIPWLKTGDLNDGLITTIPEYITEEGLNNSSAKLNPAGSVLIAMYGATIGKVGILGIPATTNQACCACVDYNGIIRKYLFYFLLSYKEEFIALGGGGAQPNISKDIIVKTFIPVPPIQEQIRIVSEIEGLLALLDSLDNNKSALGNAINQAKSKILDLAIHGKLTPQNPTDEPASELLKRINPKAIISCDNPHYENIPSTWVCTTIGSIFQHNTGKALNKSTSEEGTLLPYLTTSNVYWNSFDLSVIKEMRFKDSEMDKCTVQKGDLLVCEGGDIGRSAIWDNDYSVCIQNHLHRLRPKGDVIPLLYMYYIMHLKRTNNIEGKGIGLQGLSSGMLDKLKIPLPPYNEQKRIVDKIKETFDILDSITESLSLS